MGSKQQVNCACHSAVPISKPLPLLYSSNICLQQCTLLAPVHALCKQLTRACYVLLSCRVAVQFSQGKAWNMFFRPSTAYAAICRPPTTLSSTPIWPQHLARHACRRYISHRYRSMLMSNSQSECILLRCPPLLARSLLLVPRSLD